MQTNINSDMYTYLRVSQTNYESATNYEPLKVNTKLELNINI